MQQPGGQGGSSGGQREFVPVLARAAVAVVVAGYSMETHQDPDNAPSDGPCMVKLEDMKSLLAQLQKSMRWLRSSFMVEKIKDIKSYKKEFEGKEQNALQYALDIRKFEIELYWKRAAYFWVFIGLAFTGYFSKFPSGDKNHTTNNFMFGVCVFFCMGF